MGQYSDWMISKEVHEWIFNYLPKGSTILELGSGDGSAILGKRYKVYSVENDLKWINRHKKVGYIYAPLKNGWYDLRAVPRYDLLIVDGPKGSQSKVFFEKHLSLFDKSKPAIIDDTHREGERLMAERLGGGEVIKSGNKQATVIWL